MDAVEDIKSRISIEDVVSEYVQLKRAGRNFKGMSPFTTERTPSFIVSPEKAIWHDFSSGKGGDVFTFVQEMEGVDFKTALEILARKAGVELTQYSSNKGSGSAQVKERCYEALELATKFYQIQLSKNKDVQAYVFKDRGFKRQVALDFKLGYSPNTGDALLKYLTKMGFSKKELSQAGLITTSYRGDTDMFRGRLMIPLSDGQGRVIGFTARDLDNNSRSPKYINTPQTILYDKSRHVYGLHLAKEAIRKNEYVVIAEGNLDVIASHQVGIKQVVATAGTAITEQHLKIIRNLTSDVRLAFDQDRAGIAATERAIPIASKVGVNLEIITISDGKDPDELIKINPLSWQNVIEKPQYAVDWLIDHYKSQFDLSEAQDKRKFSDVVLPVVSKLVDPVERDHYLTELGNLLGISKEALSVKTTNISDEKSAQLRRKKTQNVKLDKEFIEQNKNQDQLLAICLINKTLRKYIKQINDEMIIGEAAPVVLNFLKANNDFQGDPLTVKELNKHQDYVKMLMLQYEALYQNLDENDLEYEAKLLQDRLIIKYVKKQKDALSTAMYTADEVETQKLLNKAKELDSLLKQTKEVLHG
jgi:DNA primase